MIENHKYEKGLRIKYDGIFKQDYPLAGEVITLLDQDTDTELESQTISTVNPVTEPSDEPMYVVKWDERDDLAVIGESNLLPESSIFVDFYADDEHIILATFVDSLPTTNSEIHVNGILWEVIDVIALSNHTEGSNAWKVVLRMK